MEVGQLAQPRSSLPSISIVVPSLNQGRFIRETLESILNQDVPPLELFVVDGGSTDETLSVLRSFGNRLSFTSEPDRGQSDAINRGLRRVSGDIVCYLNSDDVLQPGCLRRVATHFRDNPETSWLFGRCRIVDAKGRQIRSLVETYKRIWARFARYRWSLLTLNYIPQPATFWRAAAMEQVGLMNESLYYSMDYDLWLRFIELGRPGFIDEYLASFRLHDQSKTLSGARMQLAEALDVAKRHGAGRLAPLHRAHDMMTLLGYSLRYRQSIAVEPSRA